MKARARYPDKARENLSGTPEEPMETFRPPTVIRITEHVCWSFVFQHVVVVSTYIVGSLCKYDGFIVKV